MKWTMWGCWLAAMAVLPSACLMEESSCEWTDTCLGASDDGGTSSGDGGPRPVTGPCTGELRPYEDGCFAEEGTGSFVSTTAASGGDGSKARPFSRVSQALAVGGRIYVCNGDYAEPLVLTGDKSVTVFGGLSCDTWAIDTAGSTVLTAGANETPLTVRNQTASAHLNDVQVVAVDATGQESSGAGRSSVAAMVTGSSDVQFTRSHFVAGASGNGAEGAAGEGNAKPGLGGSLANGVAGGAIMACSCADGSESVGGRGGDGSTASKDGVAGSATPEAPADALYTGAGGVGGTGNAPQQFCTPGSDGALGGAGGQTTSTELPLTLEAGGVVVRAPSAAGGNGNPGQGGGGGGGKSNAPQAGGGGGGCGGCGGSGGGGGWAGGSSVGIASFESTLKLVECTVRTSKGATGGGGGRGESGGSGGGGAAGACSGGTGGHGGGGAGGNGGAGGASVGILYKGQAPTVDGAAIEDAAQHREWQIGAGGNGGAAGPGGAAIDVNERQSREGAQGIAGATGLQGAIKALP